MAELAAASAYDAAMAPYSAAWEQAFVDAETAAAAFASADEALSAAIVTAAADRDAAYALALDQTAIGVADSAYAAAVAPHQTARDAADAANQVAQSGLTVAEAAWTAADTVALTAYNLAIGDAGTVRDAAYASAEQVLLAAPGYAIEAAYYAAQAAAEQSYQAALLAADVAYEAAMASYSAVWDQALLDAENADVALASAEAALSGAIATAAAERDAAYATALDQAGFVAADASFAAAVAPYQAARDEADAANVSAQAALIAADAAWAAADAAASSGYELAIAAAGSEFDATTAPILVAVQGCALSVFSASRVVADDAWTATARSRYVSANADAETALGNAQNTASTLYVSLMTALQSTEAANEAAAQTQLDSRIMDALAARTTAEQSGYERCTLNGVNLLDTVPLYARRFAPPAVQIPQVEGSRPLMLAMGPGAALSQLGLGMILGGGPAQAPTPPGPNVVGRQLSEWFERLTPAQQTQAMTNPALRARLLTTVPGGVAQGAFQRWFNALTVAELDTVLENPTLREHLMDRLRSPRGVHEWLMRSRVAIFKRWGVTAEQIFELRTATSQLPRHASTADHNSLGRLIDTSPDFATFRARLQGWANRNTQFIPGGAARLPAGLRIPPPAAAVEPLRSSMRGPNGGMTASLRMTATSRMTLGLRGLPWAALALTVPSVVEEGGLLIVERREERLTRQAEGFGITPRSWHRISNSATFRNMLPNQFLREVERTFAPADDEQDLEAVARINGLQLNSADWASLRTYSQSQRGYSSARLRNILDQLVQRGDLVERTERAQQERALALLQEAGREGSPEHVVIAIMVGGRRVANIINNNPEFQERLLRVLEDAPQLLHQMVTFLGLPYEYITPAEADNRYQPYMNQYFQVARYRTSGRVYLPLLQRAEFLRQYYPNVRLLPYVTDPVPPNP